MLQTPTYVPYRYCAISHFENAVPFACLNQLTPLPKSRSLTFPLCLKIKCYFSVNSPMNPPGSKLYHCLLAKQHACIICMEFITLHCIFFVRNPFPPLEHRLFLVREPLLFLCISAKCIAWCIASNRCATRTKFILAHVRGKNGRDRKLHFSVSAIDSGIANAF